jgi:hypothetical protein
MMNATLLDGTTTDMLNVNLQKITNLFVYYSFLTLSNLSFLSNILNILVCSRMKIRKNTFSLYNTFMSLFNMLSLVFSYLIYFPSSIGRQDLLLKSTLNCLLITYFNKICVQMCSWLNVSLSIDRTICVAFPNRFLFHKRKRNIILMCSSLFLVICLVNVENFLGNITIRTYLASAENRTLSFLYCISLSPVGPVSDIISQVMRTVLPVLLEFLLNAILIYKLWRSRSRNVQVKRSLYRDYKFAFLIVILNFLFLITQTPLMVVTIYICVINYVSQANSTFENDTYLVITKYLPVLTGVFATYMFGSIFFVNLFFNRIFQMELCNSVDEIMIKLRLLKIWCVKRFREASMKSFKFNTKMVVNDNNNNDYKTKSERHKAICVSYKSTFELNVYFIEDSIETKL